MKNVLVVGDVIIDRYVHCSRRGLSAETPTIVGNFQREDAFLGGAGVVVRNLMRLGHNVVLLSPTDWDIEYIVNSPDNFSDTELARVSLTAYPGGLDFHPTEKIRYFVEGYKLFQMDKLCNPEILNHDDLFQLFLSRLDWADCVVISDNRHGMMKESFIRNIVVSCQEKKKKLFVDSQVSQEKSNHHLYAGCDFMFLNDREREILLDDESCESMRNLSKKFDCNLIFKHGSNGSSCCLKDGFQLYAHPFKVNAVDTCGAGDAFLAAFVSSDDMLFANKWAALSTTKIGTMVPSLSELDKL